MLRSLLRRYASRLLLQVLGNKQIVHGIIIGEHLTEVTRDPEFLSSVRQALDLLRRYDPPRFRRVKRSLTFVYSRPIAGSMAMYEPSLNACAIDPSNLEPGWREHETFLHYLAATIVHEATHSEIRRRTRLRDWTREEPICGREQWECYEILTRMSGIEIDAGWIADAKQYDPRYHRVYYNKSRLARVRDRLRRVYGGSTILESLRRAFRGQTAGDPAAG